jgi:hypothetical protein
LAAYEKEEREAHESLTKRIEKVRAKFPAESKDN